MKIEKHPTDSTYTLGQNQFMDMTNEEFKTKFLGLKGAEKKRRK